MRYYTDKLILFGLFFSVLSIQACEKTPNSGIDETVEFIQSTVPIPEAQNVTMDLRSGSNAGVMHIITLSEIESNPVISNGVKGAWCIEWDVRSFKEPQTGVKLHSTEGQNYWKKLNYLLNQIDFLKQQHPELTWKEIQIAMWSIIDYKPFNMDKIPEYQSFPGNLYKDGEYLFDVDLAKKIVQFVRNNSATSSAGEKFGIIVENKGQIVVTASEQN